MCVSVWMARLRYPPVAAAPSAQQRSMKRVFWRPPAPLSAGGVCGWAERGARCVGCAGQDPRLLGCVCAWVPLVMGVGSKGGSGQDPRLLGCACAWAASCVTPTLPLELCLHKCHRLRCSGCCPRCCCCSAVAAGSARQLVHTACTILICHCLPAPPCRARAQRRVVGRHRQASDGRGEPCCWGGAEGLAPALLLAFQTAGK